MRLPLMVSSSGVSATKLGVWLTYSSLGLPSCSSNMSNPRIWKHISLAKFSGLRRKPRQPFLVDEDTHWVASRKQNVNAEVKLQTSDEVGLTDVALHNTGFLTVGNGLEPARQKDSLPLTGSLRFDDVRCGFIAFPLLLELRGKVSGLRRKVPIVQAERLRPSNKRPSFGQSLIVPPSIPAGESPALRLDEGGVLVLAEHAALLKVRWLLVSQALINELAGAVVDDGRYKHHVQSDIRCFQALVEFPRLEQQVINQHLDKDKHEQLNLLYRLGHAYKPLLLVNGEVADLPFCEEALGNERSIGAG
ncbi:unnamed protein product [Sphagnum balticum]